MPDSVSEDLQGESVETVDLSEGLEAESVETINLSETDADKSANATDKENATEKETAAKATATVIPSTAEPVTLDPEQVAQGKKAQSDYNRAVGELRKGNLDSALARFQQLAAQYPALGGPIVNQAIILRKQGKQQEAYDLIQANLLQHSKNPHLLNELGVVSRQLGKFKQAQVSYESAIRIDARFATAHYNLGVLADLYLHDPLMALQEFQTYQTLIPEPDKTVAGWIIELERRAARSQ